MNADDVRFRIVRLIEQRPEITQRELAAELGVSLGKVNYCLRALAEKGHVKLTRFRRRSNKMHYAYLLTPAGVQAKASATLQFLRSKVEEYERLRLEIEELSAELRVDTEQASQRDEASST